METLQILIEEKKLVFSEKMQLIKTSKAFITLVIPVLTLIVQFAKTYQELYLLVPFVICTYASFYLANQHTLNLVFEYLNRLDCTINKELGKDLPLYQITVGQMMAEGAFNLTKEFKKNNLGKKITPNPYVLFGISLALFVIVPIELYSIKEGGKYLNSGGHYNWEIIFYIFGYLSIASVLFCGITYGLNFLTIRSKLFDIRYPIHQSSEIEKKITLKEKIAKFISRCINVFYYISWFHKAAYYFKKNLLDLFAYTKSKFKAGSITFDK